MGSLIIFSKTRSHGALQKGRAVPRSRDWFWVRVPVGSHMFFSLRDIEHYLQSFIPGDKITRFPGEEGIVRTKEFLKLLGSPQNKLKVIHVAGTSGKGSTSFLISTLLELQGCKVGLHLSPHLIDIRERTEINNTFIEEKKYVRYFEEITPAIEKMKDSPWGMITYFEILVGFAYYVFFQEKVDYAVMEVGLGGKYDGTNVVNRQDKLAIITKIGFDHEKILGNTLTKIAYQKAQICPEKGDIISIYQHPSVEREIIRIVHKKGARLALIEKNTIRNVRCNNTHTQFSLEWKGRIYRDIIIGLFGPHQAQNAALSLAAVFHLATRDGFAIDVKKLCEKSRNVRFMGRMDIIQEGGKALILDGAHNRQKMKAFLTALSLFAPGKKHTFILAFKNDKDYPKMLHMILPFAHKIIITSLFSDNQDLHHFSTNPVAIRNVLEKNGFTNVEIMEKQREIKHYLEQTKEDVVVTGSLYLLGDIYKILNPKS